MFDSKISLLLQGRYIYVRCSKGFQLEGLSGQQFPMLSGFFRFSTDNVRECLSDNYIRILYDSSDVNFLAWTNDVYLDEVQEDVVVSIENLQNLNEVGFSGVSSALQELHTDVSTGFSGVSSALQELHNDVDGVETKLDAVNGSVNSGFSGVSSALQVLHNDVDTVETKLDAVNVSVNSGFSGVSSALQELHTDVSTGFSGVSSALQELHTDVDTVETKLDAVNGSVNSGFSGVSSALQELHTDVSTGFSGVSSALQVLHNDVDGVEAKLDTVNGSVNTGFGGVSSALQVLHNDVDGVETKLDNVASKLDTLDIDVVPYKYEISATNKIVRHTFSVNRPCLIDIKDIPVFSAAISFVNNSASDIVAKVSHRLAFGSNVLNGYIRVHNSNGTAVSSYMICDSKMTSFALSGLTDNTFMDIFVYVQPKEE